MSRGESVASLRAYFFLAGTLVGALNLLALASRPPGLGSALPLVGVALAASFFYLGVRLKVLIVSAPKRTELIVLVAGGFLALNLLASLFLGSVSGIAQSVVGLLITWYLVANLRRLAREGAGPEPKDAVGSELEAAEQEQAS